MQIPFDPRKNLSEIFATPLGSFEVPGHEELMPRIAEVILAKEKTRQGVTRSNKGGWHSDDTLLNWPEMQFANLSDIFRSAVAHMIASTSGFQKFQIDLGLTAWANVNRAGGAFNSPHIHPDHHWSGVLYVRIPEFTDDPIDKAGHIEFRDPRGPIAMVQGPGQVDGMSLPPRQGVMLLFPSWLYHHVNPYSVGDERISIAFNARIRQFKPVES